MSQSRFFYSGCDKNKFILNDRIEILKKEIMFDKINNYMLEKYT